MNSLFLLGSCGSIQGFSKRTFQKDAKEIAELSFINKTRFIKTDNLWIVDSTENKKTIYNLTPNGEKLYGGKMPIELHIKDSLLRKELLSPENIEYFKKQLNAYEYNLVTQNLIKHPKIKVAPEDTKPNTSFFYGEVYGIKSVMFTKDRKYAIYYEYKANAFSGITIVKKNNGKWGFYRSFMISIS